MPCIFLWSSAVSVRDSQAYRKMDVTRERISRILELREILLSIGLDNAAVACAILESISGLDMTDERNTTQPKRLMTIPRVPPYTLRWPQGVQQCSV